MSDKQNKTTGRDENRGLTVVPKVPTPNDGKPVNAGRTVIPTVPTPTNKK